MDWWFSVARQLLPRTTAEKTNRKNWATRLVESNRAAILLSYPNTREWKITE
jgi:hypothetical protein